MSLRCHPVASLAILLSLSSAALADDLSAWQTKADSGVEQLQAAELWVGGAVSVYTPTGSSVVFNGEEAPGSGHAPDANSVFEIGSVSKSFTGIMLAQIIGERADLSLDSSVAKFIPQLAGTFAGRITLRQLATHTSGLPRLPCTDTARPECFHPADSTNPYADYTSSQLIDYLKTFNRNDSGPFARDYSNTGVALLGYLLTKIEQKSFDEILSARITGPLGMNHTKVLRPHVAYPANLINGFVIDKSVANHWEWDVFAPTGGIVSTADDMMKYLAANANPSATSLGRAILTSHDQRLCWDSLPGAPIIWKNGQTGGFHSIMLLDPKAKTGIFVLSNLGSSYGDSVATMPFNVAIPNLMGTNLTDAQLHGYVGNYQCGADNSKIALKKIGHFLFVESSELVLRLDAISDIQFNAFDGVNTDGFHQVVFQKTSSGHASGMTLHLNKGDGSYDDVSCVSQ